MAKTYTKKTTKAKVAPKVSEPKPAAKETITESGHKAAMTKKDARIKELEDTLVSVGFGHKI